MPKAKTVFVCQQCGYESIKWVGQCPGCNEWNTLVETMLFKESPTSSLPAIVTQPPRPIAEIAQGGFQRLPIPMEEFNRTLGGGIVPGSVILVGGDPGIGKSTLLLQLSALLAEDGRKILYVSGEESAEQIKMRADRLGIVSGPLYILAETNLDAILLHIEQLSPSMVVVDSIQSVYLEGLTSSAGSISQVRECATALLRLAKAHHVPIFIIGHVTKSGAIAGPRVLEHMVDTVLYLEGERFHAYRLLRSVKNRFGSTNEVGVFEMQQEGLVEISNPSQVFLAERLVEAAGSAIAVTMEGTRPILVEVQALTSTTTFGLPRRTANGIDFNRLLLLTAVLSKRVGLSLSNQDIYVNVVGGLRITEPAVDLAVATAIASSFRNLPIASDLVLIGEVGLSGELRSVGQVEKRVTEAAKLGFQRCLMPKSTRLPPGWKTDIEICRIRSLGEALEAALVH